MDPPRILVTLFPHKFFLTQVRKPAEAEKYRLEKIAEAEKAAIAFRKQMEEQMQKRIMVIDGAMGTTIQQYKFTEEDFRGA